MIYWFHAQILWYHPSRPCACTLSLLKMPACSQIYCCLHGFPALKIQLLPLRLGRSGSLANLLLGFFVLNFCQNQPINRRPGVAWSNELCLSLCRRDHLTSWSEFCRLLADEWRRCTVMWLQNDSFHPPDFQRSVVSSLLDVLIPSSVFRGHVGPFRDVL